MIYAMPEIFVHTDASVIINYLRLIFSLCIFTMYMPHYHHVLKVIIILSHLILLHFFVYVCMSCYRKLHLIIIIFAIMTLAWNSILKLLRQEINLFHFDIKITLPVSDKVLCWYTSGLTRFCY